jgi:hypothetical protein
MLLTQKVLALPAFQISVKFRIILNNGCPLLTACGFFHHWHKAHFVAVRLNRGSVTGHQVIQGSYKVISLQMTS